MTVHLVEFGSTNELASGYDFEGISREVKLRVKICPQSKTYFHLGGPHTKRSKRKQCHLPTFTSSGVSFLFLLLLPNTDTTPSYVS